MSDWLLEVTDLKQYTFCPRIVYYRYCLPRIRLITYSMEEGIRSHEEEETREELRNIVENEIMPSPPNSLSRCVTCEFRLFCNDVI